MFWQIRSQNTQAKLSDLTPCLSPTKVFQLQYIMDTTATTTTTTTTTNSTTNVFVYVYIAMSVLSSKIS